MALVDIWNMTEGADSVSLSKTLEDRYRLGAVPKLNAMRCTSGKREKDPCTLCAQICPKGVYPSKKNQMPNWSACIGCGLCAAVCPDKCIAPPLQRTSEYIRQLGRSGALEVSCRRAEGTGVLEVYCLAALSSEQMALAALSGGLVLNVARCADCPESCGKEQLARTLEQCEFLLGEEVFREKVTFSSEVTQYVGSKSGMSRRELFTSFFEMDVDRAFNVLPELESKQDNGLMVRAMLRDRIREIALEQPPAQRPRYKVKLPAFTEECFNCGTCAWKCPQKALKLYDEADSILATVDVWRCTGCGLCQTQCKVGAITGIVPMKVGTLGKTALKRIPAFLCEDCGKPRPKDAPEGVCGVCLGRRKMERIRQQRQQERMVKSVKQEQP